MSAASKRVLYKRKCKQSYTDYKADCKSDIFSHNYAVNSLYIFRYSSELFFHEKSFCIAVFLIGPVNGIVVSMIVYVVLEKTMKKGEV